MSDEYLQPEARARIEIDEMLEAAGFRVSRFSDLEALVG